MKKRFISIILFVVLATFVSACQEEEEPELVANTYEVIDFTEGLFDDQPQQTAPTGAATTEAFYNNMTGVEIASNQKPSDNEYSDAVINNNSSSNNSNNTNNNTNNNSSDSEKKEDGQNPVMNIIGKYTADKYEMTISASGTDSANVVIKTTEGNKTTTWTMTGKFDTNTMTIEYSAGNKKETTTDASTSSSTDNNIYDNGTGKIVYNQKENNFTWVDDKEKAGENLTFK